MSKLALYAFLLLFGLCWGATIPLTKVAVGTGHHPFGLVFWQMALAVLVLSVMAYFRKSKLVFDRRHLTFFLVIALIGTIVPNGFSYFAAFHLPAGVMALLIATVPVFSILIALTIGFERLDKRRILGVGLGLAAVALLVLPESSLPDPAKVVFVFVALLAPMAYGAEGNYVAVAQPDDTGPIATLLGASLVGVFISLALALATDGFIDPRQGLGGPEWALILSTLLHLGAYLGYIWMVKKAGPVFTSQVAYIVTPAGMIFSALFLGESHSPWLWLSLGVMLFALTLVQPRQQDQD